MDSLTSIKLAELRQHDLRADAARARPAAEARRGRRHWFVDWRGRLTRLWRRRHAVTTPATTTPAAATTPATTGPAVTRPATTAPVATRPVAQSVSFEALASELAAEGSRGGEEVWTR